jgi:2-haloacid dehalogenase
MLDFSRFTTLTFDCYGTLIDWETGIVNALRPLLARYGVESSDDALLELFGELESEIEAGPYLPYREVLARVAARMGERLGFAPTAAECATFGASVGDWPPFPDTGEALQALARHFKLVILSNVDDDLFAESARHLPVAFHAVITAQQVGSYKPNPRNFAYALDRLAIPQAEILHVAQSLFHDIEPANAAGFTTVWVNRRHDRPGFGATPPAAATPALEVPDLATLARRVGEQSPGG